MEITKLETLREPYVDRFMHLVCLIEPRLVEQQGCQVTGRPKCPGARAQIVCEAHSSHKIGLGRGMLAMGQEEVDSSSRASLLGISGAGAHRLLPD